MSNGGFICGLQKDLFRRREAWIRVTAGINLAASGASPTFKFLRTPASRIAILKMTSLSHGGTIVRQTFLLFQSHSLSDPDVILKSNTVPHSSESSFWCRGLKVFQKNSLKYHSLDSSIKLRVVAAATLVVTTARKIFSWGHLQRPQNKRIFSCKASKLVVSKEQRNETKTAMLVKGWTCNSEWGESTELMG